MPLLRRLLDMASSPRRRVALARVAVPALLAVCLTVGAPLAGATADALDDAARAKVDKILERLRGESEPVLKEGPIDDLVEMGPKAVTAAMPDLMPLLDSPDAGLRKAVVKAIGPPVHLSQAQVLVLRRMIADPDNDVRAAVNIAITAAQEQGNVDSTAQREHDTKDLSPKQLLEALESTSLPARESAEKVARDRLLDPDFCHDVSGQAATVAKLVANPDASVRALALTLLARCWKELPPEALAAATNAASDTDDDAARAALSALAHAPHHGAGAASAVKAVRYEAGVRQGATLGQALAALADLGAWDDDLAAIALAALDDPAAQIGACTLINRQGVKLPAIAPRLAKLVADKTADVEARAAAMTALAVAGDPKDTGPLFAGILANTAEAKRPRQAAVFALQTLGADARPVLPTIEQVAANENDTEVRLAAKSAVQLIKSH